MLNFVGIGAQKAGTTWLYEHLRRHPDVFIPDDKEFHFWNRQKHLGLDWYNQSFETGDSRKCGDITPAYGILPVEVIKEVYTAFPDVKLIFIMRDPIERAWSAALMGLKRAELEFDEVTPDFFFSHVSSKGSRQRGDYMTCIQNWLSVYPREQLLLLEFEEIKSDPVSFLRKVCSFIEVDPKFFSESEKELLSKKVFEGSRHPISPEIEAYLKNEVYTAEVAEKLRQYIASIELPSRQASTWKGLLKGVVDKVTGLVSTGK